MQLKTILLFILFLSWTGYSAISNSKTISSSFFQNSEELKRSKILPFAPGEKLEYIMHYGLLNAGIAELHVKSTSRVFNNERKAINMVGKGWTTGATNWFFKVKDHYETYMDIEKMEALYFKRRVDEGGYIINQDYFFNQDSNQVMTQENKNFEVPDGVQDMLSSFYFMRTLDFSNVKIDDIFIVPAFVDNKVEYLRIKYKGKEEIEIRNGKYRCLKFNPLVLKGRVFKADEDLTVWISDDDNKIPVLIQSKIIVGSIKAELSAYEGLKHPFSHVE